MEFSAKSCVLSGATIPSPLSHRTARMLFCFGCCICAVAKDPRRRGPQSNEDYRATGAVRWTGQRRCSKARWPAAGEGAEDRFWRMDGTLREQHSQRKAVPLAGNRSPCERSLQCNPSMCLNEALAPLSRSPCLISGQLQCRLNSSQQNLVAERLPEESERACLHGLRSCVGIVPS
jgi:hypothetical protein